MNNRYKRLLALLLACVLAVGALPAYAREFELPEDPFEDPALNAVNASFSANTKTDNNAIQDGEGWYPNHPVGTYAFDVQWDTTNLYIVVYHPDTTSRLQATTVTFASKAYTSSDTTEVTSEFSWSDWSTHYTACTELIVPLSDVNISGITDYGVKIPASITVGTDTWEGTIVLASTKWEHTTYSNPAAFTIMRNATRTGTVNDTYQNTKEVTGGINIFDKYNSRSDNTPAVRIHARWNELNAFNYCEFDMKITSLPVYKLGDSAVQDYKYAVHGINWWMAGEEIEVNGELTNSGYGISMGIINTEDGLIFVLRTDGPDQTVRLNRNVGDTLHLGCRWEADDSLTLFLDGEKLANLKNAKMRLNTGKNLIDFVSLRSDKQAASAADDIDVTVTNIAAGNSYGESLLDRLTFDDFKGNNVNQYAITQKLSLPTDPNAGPLSNGGTISWASSAPSIIAVDGTVKRPAVSTKVTLTASYGGTSKRFTLTVLGTNPTGNYLFVENDLKTATGAGVSTTEDFSFTLDRYNSSIVYNQGSKQKVNVIELVDSDASNRLNESVLTIWYSNDNVTYTQLEDAFKILRKGNKTYLYDFEVEAQYIKVHCTHYDIYEADFTNTITDMIKVDYVEMEFRNESQVVLENDTNKAVYDQPYEITLENAGVVTDKADKPYADVRFYLDGELLYHYFDGENFVVRVPRIGAYGAVTLTVLSGNVNAADISNKEYVHEVVYGTRESCDVNYKEYSANYNALAVIPQNELPHYLVSMPGGVMWGFMGHRVGFFYKVSHDGGRTWSNNYERPTETVTVDRRDENGVADVTDVRGAIYDEGTGRVIVMCKNQAGRISFLYADIEITDKGPAAVEWQKCNDVTYANGGEITTSLDTYSKPVKLTSYSSDPADTGVDFVVPVCIGADADGDYMVSAIYSIDAGNTWILSDYQITAEKGNILNIAEDGLTEANILEDDNGRLVMLSRYQYGEIVNFAVAYSYDGGISWTNEEDKPATTPADTTVYANKSTVYTSNTQPSMYEYGGQDLLFWGGNNVLGGISYQRFPLNVAVSYDNMKSFENIQDIFSRYSMQGMTMGDRMNVTNQSVDSSIDDTVTLIWYHEDNSNQTMIIDNFTDYFYRTKGAYDSFENSTVKYEGWSSVYGDAEVSSEKQTDGTYSMMIPGGVAVVRSIPYLQNGKIAFDLYLDNVSTAYAEIELESAYGTEYGKAAPIAFKINTGKLYFRDANGNDVEVAATLENGWNHFEFDLALLAQAPSATLSVNSGEAVELPIDLAIGDYICYVDITTGRGMNYYVDSFLVEDKDVVSVPGEKSGPEVYGNSILLGKNFAVNYYVEKSQLAAGGYENPYMTFVFNGEEITVTEKDEVGEYYAFTFSNLAPNQLTDHIYATLHATAADGSAYVSDTTFYSVAKYCYNQLANESTSAELRTLLVDLLNYGTASQLNKDVNATNLANADLTEAQLAWGSKTYDALTDYTGTVGTVGNPAATWDAVSLVLKDSVVIRMYFKADDITNLTIKAEGAGKTWTIPASSFKKDDQGRYYADFGKLNPAQMREVINFTVYNGNTAVSLTLQYSIESYVYVEVENPQSPKLKELVESMIKYGDATKKYVDSQSSK